MKTLDPQKTIRKVCIRLNKQNNFIFGVKILDDTGAELANLFDSGAGYGEWQTQEIPEGKEIIGFYGNTTQERIQCFGLVVWTPNPAAIE